MDLLKLEVLQRLKETAGPEMASELVERLCNFDLAEFQGALDRGDGPTLTQRLHRLNSDCGWLGALALRELVSEMELLADAGQLEEVSARSSQLTDLFEQTKSALEKAT